MFSALQVGAITEPLTRRKWDRQTIIREFHKRIHSYHEQGMRESDRVFLHFGNKVEFFVDVLAIWSLGGCVIPIDSRLTPFEVETLARAARPRFSLWHEVVDESIASSLSTQETKVLDTSTALISSAPDQVPPISGTGLRLDQAALILFTSGTTGQPKGVVHTHRSLRARWITLQQNLGLAKFRRTLCLLPTHFGHGLICNCLFPWLFGQDLFILPPFDSAAVVELGKILDEHEITFMSSVPSVWRLALKVSGPPQSKKLERVFCGSAPLSAFLWQQIQEWTGTREVFNAYGITETGSWVAGTTVPNFTPEDGFIGEPWGAVVRILKSSRTEELPAQMQECAPGEPGYIWLNTPALMQGYFERDDLTNQVVNQGWFMTGDIGVLDERGLLYLRGREREEINKGGMKVYPGDIDAVAERFEGVSDVCCFGYDDNSLYGQNIGVALVMNDANDGRLRHLYDWMKRHLATHQMPVRWYVVNEIPRSSRGKINRTKVSDTCTNLTPIDVRKLAK